MVTYRSGPLSENIARASKKKLVQYFQLFSTTAYIKIPTPSLADHEIVCLVTGVEPISQASQFGIRLSQYQGHHYKMVTMMLTSL